MILLQTIKNIAKAPLRTIATIATIVLCCVMVFWGMIYNQIVKEEFYTSKVIEAENADIRIEYASESETRIMTAVPLAPYMDEIDFAIGILDIFGTTNYNGELQYINLRGITEEGFEALNDIEYVEARNSKFREDDIIITQSTAEFFGLALNKSINIKLRDTEKRFIVGRIVADHPSFEQSGAFVFYAKETYLSSIFPLGGFGKIYNKIFIKTLPETNIDDLLVKLSKIEEYKGMSFSKEQDTVVFDEFAKEIAMPVIIALASCALLALVLVYMILSSGIKKRIEYISQLKAVGGNNSYIYRIFFLESCFYIIIGIGLGILFNTLVLKNYIPKLMHIDINNPFYNQRIILSSAITGTMALLLVLYPIFKTRKVSIRTAYISSKNSIWESNIAILVVSIILVLAAFFLVLPHHLNATRGLIAFVCLLVGGILLVPYLLRAVVILLLKLFKSGILNTSLNNVKLERGIGNNVRILFAGIVISSLVGGASMLAADYAQQSIDSIDCDIMVMNVRLDTPSQLNIIKGVDGVYDAYGFQQKDGNIELQGKKVGIKILGVTPEDFVIMRDIGTITSREELIELLKNEDGTLIDYMYYKIHKINIGDEVALTIGGTTKKIKVIGFFDSQNFAGKVAVMNNLYIKRMFDLPLYNTITCKTTNDIDETLLALRAALGEHNVVVIEKVTAYEKVHSILQNTISFGYYLSIFIMLVSFVGVFINIINSREERKLARYQMYSLGNSRFILMLIEVIENAISGAFALLLSFGALVLLNKVLSNVLAISSIYVKIVVQRNISLLIGLAFIVVYMLSAVSSYFVINKKKLIKILKS